MGKISITTESKWQCDICDKIEMSDDYSHPDSWNEIIVSHYNKKYGKNGIDWSRYWRGLACNDCVNPEKKKYHDITSEPYAKTFLKKLFEKLKGNK